MIELEVMMVMAMVAVQVQGGGAGGNHEAFCRERSNNHPNLRIPDKS